MLGKLKRLVLWVTIAAGVAAVVEQLRRPEALRTWRGDVLGIPYDFRKPSLERWRRSMWNPQDDRLFVPRSFGVGWDVNLHRLLQLAEAKAYEDGSD